MKERTGSTLSRTKYVKCFRVETSSSGTSRNSSWLWNYCTIKRKVILSNVKQKCGPLPLGSAVNLNKLDLIEIELFIKILCGVWSSLQPDHETNKSPPRLQPGMMTGSPIWNICPTPPFLTISYIFCLPRISTKEFPYIKVKIDRSIGINYSSVNFKWTQVFLCYQSFDTLGARDFSCAVSGFGQVSQRSMNFLKIQVIQDNRR